MSRDLPQKVEQKKENTLKVVYGCCETKPQKLKKKSTVLEEAITEEDEAVGLMVCPQEVPPAGR